MVFLALQDRAEQVAGDEVGLGLAIDDRGLEIGDRLHLQIQIGLEHFRHGLADMQLAQILKVRQAFQEQDALDHLIGVLHLVDRLVIFDMRQLAIAPVLQHAGVQEVLVDGRQLILQHHIEVLDDLRIALHGRLVLILVTRGAAGARGTAVLGRI